MYQILGGVLMMAGGGMVSSFGYAITRKPNRQPHGLVGVALDRAYPTSDGALPDDLAVLIGRLP